MATDTWPWAARIGRLATVLLALGPAVQAQSTKPLAIKAGRILTVTKGVITSGVIVVRDGKIAAIGPASEVVVPPDAEVLDVGDSTVMPGLVDMHTHVGNDSGLHDYVHTMNPELRIWDYVDPNERQVADALASGITTIMTIPGSGGNHAGYGVLWKLAGAPREELIIRKLGCMKIAQAYNPERRAGDLGLGRMGMWWMLRDLLSTARSYNDRWSAYERDQRSADALSRTASVGAISARPAPKPPAFAPELEHTRPVFRLETPVLNHTASGRDVFQTMSMFLDKFQLPVIVTHGEFGAFRVAGEAAKRNVHCNIGPRLYDFAGAVADRKFYTIPGEYVNAGVTSISLCTDSPVIPAEDLTLQGTLSVRLGMDEDLALRALTINTASAVGIGDRVGSLEIGKDADLVIKKGSIFDIRNPVERVLINGKTVYVHGQRRKGLSNYLPAYVAEDEDEP